MSTRSIRRLTVGIAVIVIGLAPFAAGAETKLADLNGEWRGAGTDRDLPFQSFQQTNCQTTIKADPRSMVTDMVCDAKDGLHKVIRLAVTVDGEQISGSVRQATTAPGSTSPSVLNGSVTGKRAGETANFQVRWSGLTPNTTVALVMHNSSSYTMHVTSLGITMMNVTFNRVAKR